MRDKTCCFTGHRNIPETEYAKIQEHLESVVTRLVYQGVQFFGVGGALGFGTMSALAILKLKVIFPHIRLILVLPCKNHTRNWNSGNKKIYSQIRSKADKTVYTSEHYHSGCMYKRNRHLADNSGICICYLTKTTGGTAYTVDYAKEKGLKIINLALC